MAKFLFKRALALIGILLLVSMGTFYLVHLLPGNPTVTILGPNDTPHNRAVLMAQMGLNKPLWQQYLIWLGNVLLGISLVMLIFLGSLWQALGAWAMVVWMSLAGMGWQIALLAAETQFHICGTVSGVLDDHPNHIQRNPVVCRGESSFFGGELPLRQMRDHKWIAAFVQILRGGVEGFAL